MVSSIPVQLLRPLDDLLLILLGGFVLSGYFSLSFVAEIGFRDSHLAHGSKRSQPKVAVVHHLNCEFHRLWSKIHYQSISLEFSFVVIVHLDPRFPGIDFLSNDTTLVEHMVDLILGGIERYRSDIYSCVDTLLFQFLSVLSGFG